MSIIPSFFGRRAYDPVSFDLWDPLSAGFFPFDNILATRNQDNDAAAFINTKIDWKESPEAHIIKADLPGLKKEEVKVDVEDGRVLQISGERRRESEEKNDKWHRVERFTGKFLRRFRLPEDAKVDGLKATMENGVLTVTLPKQEVKKPDVKSVEISG